MGRSDPREGGWGYRHSRTRRQQESIHQGEAGCCSNWKQSHHFSPTGHPNPWRAFLQALIQVPELFPSMGLPPSTRGFWGWEGKEHEQHMQGLMEQVWQQHRSLLFIFHWQDSDQVATSKCKGGWQTESIYR